MMNLSRINQTVLYSGVASPAFGSARKKVDNMAEEIKKHFRGQQAPKEGEVEEDTFAGGGSAAGADEDDSDALEALENLQRHADSEGRAPLSRRDLRKLTAMMGSRHRLS